MGDESAWPSETVLAILAITLAVLTAVVAALHAPAFVWIVLGALAFWTSAVAVSHIGFVARRLPWWFHSKSQEKRKRDIEAARRGALEVAKRELEAEKRKYTSVLWRSEHKVASLWERVVTVVVSLKPPEGFETTNLDGQPALCRMLFNGTVYEATNVCGRFGVDVEFREFWPSLGEPIPMGRYEVEWLPSFPATVERDVVFVGTAGRMLNI